MKKIRGLLLLLIVSNVISGQSIDKLITSAETGRIEEALSADDMQGRKVFTPAIDKAADFIAAEFKKNGLQYLSGLQSYRQEFTMYTTKVISAEGSFDAKPLETKSIIALTTEADLSINNNTGYKIVRISKDSNFRREALRYAQAEENLLVIIDTSFRKNFPNLSRLSQASFKRKNNVVFVLSATEPVNYSLNIKNELTELKLANVVGMLPGKSRNEEFVIFSGHYDHLGTGMADASGDSIFNGANDDAAGTTAVIMLSRYFSEMRNNARTLVFVAFTAEESGGYGSKYFSQQMDPAKTVAMFNIEMIGTESKWGKNSAYITGYERSDFGKILQAALTTSKFHFEPDPYPEQNLFYRSDNATLAELGVPAHTISTSKMDNELNYHKQSDEIETLDIDNMAEVIKAIAISSQSIINGNETPARVAIEK